MAVPAATLWSRRHGSLSGRYDKKNADGSSESHSAPQLFSAECDYFIMRLGWCAMEKYHAKCKLFKEFVERFCITGELKSKSKRTSASGSEGMKADNAVV